MIRLLQYSTPKILLGEESRKAKSSSTAFLSARSLATAKVKPSAVALLSSSRNTSGSSLSKRATFIKRPESALSSSAPKQRQSTTPSESRTETPPEAKNSAEPQAFCTGISTTRSAPANRAIRALIYLSTTAGSPRCTKSPLIHTIIKSAPSTSLTYFS